MKSRAVLLIILLVVWMPALASTLPEVYLSEVMSSNGTVLADDDGDYTDWIELHNRSSVPVNLEGFGLSDNFGEPFKWAFPAVTLGPGDYLLVRASGKNRIHPDSTLHTNFALASEGEEVVLTRPDGVRSDVLLPTAIPADVSYGRSPTGGSAWVFFSEPTPGAANTTPTASQVLSPPVFSHDSGFYNTGFNLTLSHPDPEVQIIYTLDGSEPGEQALQGIPYRYKTSYNRFANEETGIIVEDTLRSYMYTQPLTIEDRTPEPNRFSMIPSTWDADPFYLPDTPVSKAAVIRAIAQKPGALPSKIITRSYFVIPQNERSHLPVISLVTDPSGLFDYDDGIYVPGVDFDQWRSENPDETAESNTAANYHRRGQDAERNGYMSFFEPDNPAVAIEQETGIRIHGFTARRNPNKSLRLYARGRYGDEVFSYPFFSGVPGETHRRLILRNAGQDFRYAYLRDALAQSLVSHMRFDTQAYRPAVLYINGEYWGIHDIRERLDRHYLGIQYGLDSDNLDINETNFVPVDGDVVHYFNTIQYMLDHDLAADEHYEYITTRLDPQNFMDYQIAQMFVQNLDWPGSNVQYWRLRTDQYKPNRPYGHDGRWRWLMYDMDRTMTLYPDIDQDWTFNTLAYATAENSDSWQNPPWATLILRSLLKNEGFRHEFINRYTDQLNTAFTAARFSSLLDQLTAGIRPEMPAHLSRWRYVIESMSAWEQELNRVREFGVNRPAMVFGHLQEFFNLGDLYTVTVSAANNHQGLVKLNSMYLAENTPGVVFQLNEWSGRYFGDVPVQLSAQPHEGYVFSHWMINGERWDQESLSLSLQSDTHITAYFSDKVAEPAPENQLVHYFLFQNLPNDTPLKSIASVYSDDTAGSPSLFFSSSLAGYPFDAADPSWRTASMERRNQPTPLNYRPEGNGGISYEQTGSIRALQVRQPFRTDGLENTLILHLPTTGFDDPVLTFAAKDEDAGAYGLYIDYAVDFETRSTIDGRVDTVHTWTDAGLVSTDRYKSLLNNTYQLFSVDFSEIEQAAQNPHFRVRIRFDVQDASLANGDRVTFNNIALDAVPVSVSAPVLATDLPEAFSLGQNYPNPFNPLTTIPFTLTESAPVRLEVYNTIGQRVAVLRNEVLPAGWHEVRFDATGLSSGVYVYRLESAGQVQTRKLLLIR